MSIKTEVYRTNAYSHGGYLVTPRTTPVSSITGVVLAGGKSSRMGQDKAAMHLEPFGQSGPALAFRMADMLTEALSFFPDKAEVWLSCQADRHIPQSHAHLGRVHDTVQDAGPLAGITTALQAAKGPILVLACDMPLMKSSILQSLIQSRQGAIKDTTRRHPLLMTAFSSPQSSQKPFKISQKNQPVHDHTTPSIEPLVAIYEYAALSILQDALQKKRFSLRRIIDQEALCVVPCVENQEESFFNMNNSSECKEATQLLLRHNMEAKKREYGTGTQK